MESILNEYSFNEKSKQLKHIELFFHYIYYFALYKQEEAVKALIPILSCQPRVTVTYILFTIAE